MMEAVDDFISQQESAGTLPSGAGVAVAVVEHAKVVLSQCSGFRARDRGLAVTPETRFEVGSLTKAFTAAACAAARERGLIDFDRPINSSRRVLPLRDPAIEAKVSVADILCHRTGVPAHDLLWYFQRIDRRTLLAAISKLTPVPDAFRRAFIYSNLMYGALGQVFGELSGVRYDEFLADSVLRPLGLSATGFDISDDDADVALPYVGSARVRRIDMSCIAAAAGLKSTLHDLTRWLQFQLAGGETLELTHQPHMPADGVNPVLLNGWGWLAGRLHYGFGWFVGSAAEMRVVFHPAVIDGFSLAVALVPESTLGIIVMTNVNLSPVPGLLVEHILMRMVQGLPAEPLDAHHSSNRDQSVVGIYENGAYGTLSIKMVRAGLALDTAASHGL